LSTAKLKILQETFENSFDIDKFRTFTREFFNGPEMFPHKKRVGIWKEYADHIASYVEIAKYTDREGNNLIVLAVEIKKEKSVERARSLQRNFISKLLEMNNYEAAIVAFYSPNEDNWRLSFVRLDYTFNEKGLTLDLTPAKRYSYLVGKGEPNHTAQSQLLPIFEDDKHNPTLDEIEKAFSVEKVTKDFFEQYKEKYIQLKEYLEQDQAFVKEAEKLGLQVQQFSEQFAKKLMGQLAFLYFLQKKGWLGVRIMPEDRTLTEAEFIEIYQRQDETHRAVLEKVFIKTSDGRRKLSSREMFNISDKEAELLSDCFIGTKYDMPWGSGNKQFIRTIFNFCVENTNKNFFVHFLQPLFYEALNKKRKNHYFKKFNCKIPFLNGGLFEPLEGYNWQEVDFNIPNEIFSNVKHKNREADGILDIFDRYNFTINEDEPLEKEVAVDPEMLGKIFENLLDVKDRKSKGAFYTPREIVHYMCQESLTNYLVNEVGVPYEDMKEFILYGELIRDADKRRDVGYGKDFTIKQTIFDNIVKIDQALKNIKIADPAVGSGAFPLGMLSEIVRIRNNITEYLVWKDKEGSLGRRYGEEIIRKKRSPYRLKWETIKNSIFAVDIDPSAVDIAKLRLWLSVIVDQEINDETPEPHPLPNLDCNIMVGNSLIDEYEGIKLFDEKILEKKKNKVKEDSENYNLSVQLSWLIDNTDEMLNDMFQLQDRYFDEEDEQRKKEIKNKIDRIRDDLIEYKLQLDGNEEGLKKYKELQKNKQRPYFLWHLEFAKVFQEKGGFDIVIGNPPYLGFHHVPNKDYFRKKYNSASGKYDYYVLFIENGLNLLKHKGILSYICPSYFYKRNYGKNIRKILLSQTRIKFICDFKDYQIFDSALTYTCIFAVEKNTDNDENYIRVIQQDLLKDKAYFINQNSLTEPSWTLEKDDELDIINKIKEKCNYTLEQLTKSISQGIVTGNNNVFIIDESFIKDHNINHNFLVKVYKGRDIRNGKLQEVNTYLFYPYKTDVDGKNILIDEDEIKNLNPNLYRYLLSKKEELLSREYFKKSNKRWYELWNPRNRQHFENRKFVFSEVNNRNDFVLVDTCFYSDSACGMEIKDEFKSFENYLNLYLNSSIITYLYKKISVPKANGYLIYKNAFLKKLPVFLDDSLKLPEDINQENFDQLLAKIFNISEHEMEKIKKSIN
jgi:adenine-specific DNA-methyltransferase